MSLSLRTLLPGSTAIAGLTALPSCSSACCPRPATLWQRWWARHEGIWLHEHWYCSVECFYSGLYRHLEQAALAGPRIMVPPNRVPLGLVLLAQGDITPGQLREALQRQKNAGTGKIGEWLVRMGALSEPQVTAALATQQRCPVLSPQEPQWLAPRWRWPDSLVERYRAVPVFYNPAQSLLYVGFLDLVDHAFVYVLEQLLRSRVEPCIVPSRVHAQYLELRRHAFDVNTVEIHQRQGSIEMTRTVSNYAEQVHADRCLVGRCSDRLWIRLETALEVPLDLLFRLPTAS
jgi:hypothetical protein